jgi:hypothetical protein
MAWSMRARVTQPQSVLVRELAGESVLLNLDSESYFGLDEVGTRMWQALTGSPSMHAAFEALCAEFDVDPDQLRGDLEQFVATLDEAGLIDVHDA